MRSIYDLAESFPNCRLLQRAFWISLWLLLHTEAGSSQGLPGPILQGRCLATRGQIQWLVTHRCLESLLPTGVRSRRLAEMALPPFAGLTWPHHSTCLCLLAPVQHVLGTTLHTAGRGFSKGRPQPSLGTSICVLRNMPVSLTVLFGWCL